MQLQSDDKSKLFISREQFLRSEQFKGLSLLIRQNLAKGTPDAGIKKVILAHWKAHTKWELFRIEKILSHLPHQHSVTRQLKNNISDFRDFITSLNTDPPRAMYSVFASFLEKHIRFEQICLMKYMEQEIKSAEFDMIVRQLEEGRFSELVWTNYGTS